MSKANQTSFKPGQSGNPKGAPKKEWTMQSLIRQAMEKKDNEGLPYKLRVSFQLVALAANGDMQAIKEINNRLDGMPQQDSTLKVEGNYNINIDGLIGLTKVTTKATASDSDASQSED